MRHEDTLGAEGVRLLSLWRLAETEAAHAHALLGLLALPEGAHVVDLGSGTGELARLAHAWRPDLRWTLVNTSAWQLGRSPAWATLVSRDLTDTGLPGGCADAVVIAYALGYVDPTLALEEAHRLLAPGGALVLHELYAETRAAQQAASQALGYTPHPEGSVTLWAGMSGFSETVRVIEEHRAPGASVDAAMAVFGQLAHSLTVYRKTGTPMLAGRRAALQFSGGKDSMACLALLEPYVQRGLPVYWAHTGDTIPETLEVVEQVRTAVPDFRVVQADVMAWKRQHGIPSDVTTAQSSEMGAHYAMSETRLAGRFDCCWANLMQPMHERMLADGIDLVIRGTKLADTGRVPASGITGQYEVWLPLLHWSHEEVFDLCARMAMPRNAVYDHFKSISAPECLHCSAWWDDGKAAYLKARHPDKVGQYAASLQEIRAELARRVAELESELKECTP